MCRTSLVQSVAASLECVVRGIWKLQVQRRQDHVACSHVPWSHVGKYSNSTPMSGCGCGHAAVSHDPVDLLCAP